MDNENVNNWNKITKFKRACLSAGNTNRIK